MNLKNLIVPQHLKAGDKVATVSLSWGGAGDDVFRERYETGKRQLQETFGVEVVEMTNTLKGTEYTYKNPQARVDDLHQAFVDPSIKAIISCIGGSDSVRLIDKIDYDLIRNNPKIFMGYSDAMVTNFICLKAGLRAYNGPAIMTQFAENGGMHDYTIQSIRNTLFSNQPIGQIDSSPEGWTEQLIPWENNEFQSQLRIMQPQTGWNYIQGKEKVSGRLIGGCGEVLMMFIGSKIWPELETWRDSILFLENSEDAISSDQFLYNLRCLGACGILQVLKGILFAKPRSIALENWSLYDEVLKQTTAEFDRSDMPIITQMDFGHTDPIFTVPIGALATIDPLGKTFSIDEAGCL
jgi:muramoyltetrapeptide carboxypeptidase LdcA involved in peptidoglycan recycling